MENITRMYVKRSLVNHISSYYAHISATLSWSVALKTRRSHLLLKRARSCSLTRVRPYDSQGCADPSNIHTYFRNYMLLLTNHNRSSSRGWPITAGLPSRVDQSQKVIQQGLTNHSRPSIRGWPITASLPSGVDESQQAFHQGLNPISVRCWMTYIAAHSSRCVVWRLSTICFPDCFLSDNIVWQCIFKSNIPHGQLHTLISVYVYLYVLFVIVGTCTLIWAIWLSV
jgi:hypothetical protein